VAGSQPFGERDEHLALNLRLLVQQLPERAIGDHERPHR
jgi:hypothetical protein